MKRTGGQILFAALAIVALWAQIGIAHQGTVIKYSQPIGHLVVDPTDPNFMMSWGEDIPSDVDWKKIMMDPFLEPNWVIADDFRDPFPTPVFTVRWWGSYAEEPTVFRDEAGTIVPVPPGPGVEDGYVISFFSDAPATPTSPSHPEFLLGTYVLPFDKVKVTPTTFIGWDNRPIWEYEANLQDAHLDHAIPDYADENGFKQQPGIVYWISIIAEVGHKVRLASGDDCPTGSDLTCWISEDTGKFAQAHYWGWHTSPVHFNDVATMGHLYMPGNQWQYLQPWQPIQPQHHLFDMAFELLTIPEPGSASLLVIAIASWCGLRRRSA